MQRDSFIACEGPCAHHERTISLDQKAIHLLKKELTSLRGYHDSILGTGRNFQQANNELGKLLPFDKDPIFGKP
jgi:hypothetical protein